VFYSVTANVCNYVTNVTHLSNNVIEISHTNAYGWGCGACGNQRITGISFTISSLIDVSVGLNRVACDASGWHMDHTVIIYNGQVCAQDLFNDKHGSYNCRPASSTDTFGLEVRDNKVFYYHNGAVFYDTTSTAGTIYQFDYAILDIFGNAPAKVTVELFG
jgi:hypothetical protein